VSLITAIESSIAAKLFRPVRKFGYAGFVRVVAPDELVFPDYDGNGMFLSIGNISANPNIGVLFIDFEKQKRLRVNGTAHASRDDPLIKHTVGAQLMLRVEVREIFPNCPRYIPKMQLVRNLRRRPAGKMRCFQRLCFAQHFPVTCVPSILLPAA
jgi:predicted pyridoxine 5'-phosphate oxidase superfamily flavin-nucleotide-binding protein